jgi:hypothetical protein
MAFDIGFCDVELVQVIVPELGFEHTLLMTPALMSKFWDSWESVLVEVSSSNLCRFVGESSSNTNNCSKESCSI